MAKAYSYVRLSSDAQKRGDGFRRQTEQSRQYAAQHSLELDESFLQHNKAESAFRGDNVTTGSLGRFLDACEGGQVERGSILLVESIDRLSRQESFKALALFMRLMTAGITIVTLIDGHHYSIESSGEADLAEMLGVMRRAHDESKTKSVRGRANWSQKRTNIDNKKLTAMAPAWLKLSRDKKSFTIIKDRAEIVRRIFDEAVSGVGMYTITKRLNEEKVSTFGRSRGWHQSYIAKILSNPAVHGEFQPHYTDEGERKPFGEPIQNYYPAVVDRETFFLAQGARHQRRLNGSGRKGQHLTNLFTGLVKCLYCDGAMRLENKGPGPKGGRYFVCEAALRKHDCEAIRWRYDEFEASFLAFVEELDLGAILASKEQTSKRVEIESKIKSLNGELTTLKKERDRAYTLLTTSTLSTAYIQERLDACAIKINAVERSFTARQLELNDLGKETATHYQDKGELKRLIELVRNQQGVDVYKTRAQIVSRLKSILSEKIKLAPGGNTVEKRREQRWLEAKRATPPNDPTLLAIIADPGPIGQITELDILRYFGVSFRDGTYRLIYPNADDPMKIEFQFFGAPEDRLTLISSSGEKSELQFIDEPGD